MDEFTLRHLDTWLFHAFRPSLIDKAKELMLKTYATDPEWWGAQGWPALAKASGAWDVTED